MVSRQSRRSVEVYTHVTIDMSDIDDEDIIAEAKARNLRGQGLEIDDFDARKLAELIAAGDTDEALDFLHRISKGGFSLAFVKRAFGTSVSH